MKWLITAFEPFNGAVENSSLKALRELQSRNIDSRLAFMAPVSVTFAQAWPQVKEHLETLKDVKGVLALGQAEGRKKIGLERVALNYVDAGIDDNAGFRPPLGPIGTGPDLLWSDIPWEKFELSSKVERSYSAGTFVCNALMFELLSWAKERGKLAGFVHVPLLTSDNEDIVDELQKVLEFILRL